MCVLLRKVYNYLHGTKSLSIELLYWSRIFSFLDDE